MSFSDPATGDTASTTSASTSTSTSVREKILRRAELNRITRMLKSRLEIAHFKVGRSWQNLPFKSVEPQLEREVKLRHPEAFEDAESHVSHLSSPPREAEFLVPTLPSRGRGHDGSTSNGNATTNGANHTRQKISPLKRQRSYSPDTDLQSLGSSPLKYHATTAAMRDRGSPVSRISTPVPSTPPSAVRSSRLQSKADTEEGADLLLYLATSPSPAKSRRSNRALDFSSPPPIRGSSAVNTPVGAGFNLSEFLNFSPSPAQLPRGSRFDSNKFSPAKLTYEDSPTRIGTRHPID